MEEKNKRKSCCICSGGKIAIVTHDNQNIVFCQSVKTSAAFLSGKNGPKYSLNGVDYVNFWGEHKVILGFYASLEEVEKEISEITKAIQNGENAYKLKYHTNVEANTFGVHKMKKN